MKNTKPEKNVSNEAASEYAAQSQPEAVMVNEAALANDALVNGVPTPPQPSQSSGDDDEAIESRLLKTATGGSSQKPPKSNGAVAASPDDQTPKPPQSPSSVVEDFKPQDMRKSMRGAIFDAKPVAQTVVDTGVEVIRVGRPAKFVKVFPSLKFGHILPEDRDEQKPACLVAPDVAKRNTPPCRTAILVIWAEPVPEGAVWPVYGIWPLLQESPSTGEVSEFMQSALLKVQRAMVLDQWLQFKCIKKQRIYTLNIPDEPIIAEVKWPAPEDVDDGDVASFILMKGFEGRFIDSNDDPRLRAARSKRIE
jgi:hypothetical protein